MNSKEYEIREKELNTRVFETIITARKDAITAMALLAANDKEYSDSWSHAFNLEVDMQKMLHNQFEM